MLKETLREKCPHSELFWSLFSHIRENTDQNNSEYRCPEKKFPT